MLMSILNLFRKKEVKTVPPIQGILEETRDGVPKAFIPEFLYKPPYGYPRYSNLPDIRKLANTPFVEMCINTIISEITSIAWDIVPIEEDAVITSEMQRQIDHVKALFKNPNTNKESFENILKKIARDILEIDSAILIKVFNKKEEMVELYAKDGATFTKNPDEYGRYEDRDEIILNGVVGPSGMSEMQAREHGAYFQYGWITAAYPVAFGKREVVWFEQHPRTDSLYGRSPVEVLDEVLKTLIYAIESNLEYYNDNSIPKGFMALIDADSESIENFKKQWMEQQKTKDFLGNWKKILHHLPIVNKKPEFVRMQFSNAELELIQQQEWFGKMVWACFGVTPSELGYTENSNKATEIVQSNVFKRKAIYPLLRLIEYQINHEVVSEFEYEGIEFKFDTYDVNEELKKTKLYEMQIKNGLRTVNEIRTNENLDEVEWGDEPPKNWQSGGNTFNFPNQGNAQQNFPVENENAEEKSIEGKPFAGYRDFDACVLANRDKKDPKAYCAEVMRRAEGKAIQTRDNPLILREGEEMSEGRLKKAMVHLLSEDEKKIKELLESEVGKSKLKEIKAVDDIFKVLKGILDLSIVRRLSDQIINHNFLKGWESAEKKLDRNFLPNKDAIDYLQNYTFSNIKNMSEEIGNDLRAELQRGIINGEGIDKLKSRVTNVFNKAEVRAEAIARTEVNRAENQGTLQVMKASGQKITKKWVAAMDDRTSAICKRLHGKSVGVNESFKDTTTGQEFQGPPSHVSCRSTLTYEIGDDKQ